MLSHYFTASLLPFTWKTLCSTSFNRHFFLVVRTALITRYVSPQRVNGGGGEPVSKKPVLGYSADFVEEKSSLGYLTQSSKLSGNEPAVAKLCAPQNHWSKLKQAVKSANVVKPKALGAVAKTASFTHALSKKDDTGFEREAEQVALRLQVR